MVHGRREAVRELTSMVRTIALRGHRDIGGYSDIQPVTWVANGSSTCFSARLTLGYVIGIMVDVFIFIGFFTLFLWWADRQGNLARMMGARDDDE